MSGARQAKTQPHNNRLGKGSSPHRRPDYLPPPATQAWRARGTSWQTGRMSRRRSRLVPRRSSRGPLAFARTAPADLRRALRRCRRLPTLVLPLARSSPCPEPPVATDRSAGWPSGPSSHASCSKSRHWCCHGQWAFRRPHRHKHPPAAMCRHRPLPSRGSPPTLCAVFRTEGQETSSSYVAASLQCRDLWLYSKTTMAVSLGGQKI